MRVIDKSASSVAVLLTAALLLPVTPVRADSGFVGGMMGGIVGGMISGAMRPPAPAYPQPQPYYSPQDSAERAEARQRYLAHQAEIKKQKADQEKAKQEQEQAKLNPAPPASGVGPLSVVMKRQDGNLWVPVQINKAVAIDFVVDSGASDVTIPEDVFRTLVRTGTVTKTDIIGSQTYNIADGSDVKGIRFRLSSLQVGDKILTDVEASVMLSNKATPLLGLTFLSRFKSWTIDNTSGTLTLTLPDGAAPTQLASAGTAPVAPRNPPTPPPEAKAQSDTTIGMPMPTQNVDTSLPPTAAAAEAKPAVTSPTLPQSAAAAPAGPPDKTQPTAPALVASATPNPPKPQASGVPNFPPNTAYADARRSLMALGYEPAPLPDADKCDRNTDKTCFPEREACTQANGIQCEFFWRRGERLIKVTTMAVPPTVSSVGCQVNCQ